MTQEEKQLLLVELCGRLNCGIFVNAKSIELDGKLFEVNVRYGMLRIAKNVSTGESELVPISDVKPYLRPMSSMTEEERDKLENIEEKYFGQALDKQFKECLSSSPKDESRKLEYLASSKVVDYLNAHHFDYRGLIEKGIALEAPEGMYNTKTE